MLIPFEPQLRSGGRSSLPTPRLEDGGQSSNMLNVCFALLLYRTGCQAVAL